MIPPSSSPAVDTVVGLALCSKVHKLFALTFVTYAEADVRVALVGGEEEKQEVGGADEELGNLGALVTSDQR